MGEKTAKKKAEPDPAADLSPKERAKRKAAIVQACITYPGNYSAYTGMPHLRTLRRHAGMEDMTRKERDRAWLECIWQGLLPRMSNMDRHLERVKEISDDQRGNPSK